MVVQVGRLVFLCLFLFKLFLEILIPTQQPTCDKEGGSTETRPAPALYSDGNVLMGNIDDSVTDDLYQ